MASGREIVCVQPGCARRTRDFYVVELNDAAATADAIAGPTCVSCYEDVMRRLTREAIHPFNFDAPREFRGPDEFL